MFFRQSSVTFWADNPKVCVQMNVINTNNNIDGIRIRAMTTVAIVRTFLLTFCVFALFSTINLFCIRRFSDRLQLELP